MFLCVHESRIKPKFEQTPASAILTSLSHFRDRRDIDDLEARPKQIGVGVR